MPDVTTGILLAILMLSVGWVIFAFIPARPGLVLCGRLVGPDLSSVVIRSVVVGQFGAIRTAQPDSEGAYQVRALYGETVCIRIMNGSEVVQEMRVEQDPRGKSPAVWRTIDLGELELSARSPDRAVHWVSLSHEPCMMIWRTETRTRIAPRDRQLLDRSDQFHDPPLVQLSKTIP